MSLPTATTAKESGVAQEVAWQPNRDDALRRLRSFVPHMADIYARERNFDLGPKRRVNVSLLSPWIRHRLILETEALQLALKTWPLERSEKFVQEILWRAYFKGWMEHHPQVWEIYQADLVQLHSSLEHDTELARKFETATEGVTGIECFDTWVQELVKTGYLHNHARMWFASIWIFTLKLPWQLGAEFFYRHLLDGDPASNTLSWRWVAGLHTKGKTYLARASNILKYTDGRFPAPRNLADNAQPLQEPDYGPARELRIDTSPPTDGEFVLLVSTEDCLPETLPLSGAPCAVAGLSRMKRQSEMPVSEHVHAFSNGALDDALQRVGQCFGVETTRFDGDDMVNKLVTWARKLGISRMVSAYVPIGPTREITIRAAKLLAHHNIEFSTLHRDYDKVIWPHTRGGFFKLKKQMPAIIAALKLGNE